MGTRVDVKAANEETELGFFFITSREQTQGATPTGRTLIGPATAEENDCYYTFSARSR